MSRIGRKPINIPNNVEVDYQNRELAIKGPRGSIRQCVHRNIKLEIAEKSINVIRFNDDKLSKSLHGLTRSLVFNAVKGVTDGFERILEINGVGYKGQKKGDELVLNLGYSHPVVVKENDDIKLDVKANKIFVRGIDRQKVGQFAANIRAKRPPEPYQGKGIKYLEEIIRRKEGKAGKSAKK